MVVKVACLCFFVSICMSLFAEVCLCVHLYAATFDTLESCRVI